jgi:hypothetical protein
MNRTVILLPLLAACGRSFESVEEACKDNVHGDRDASPEAVGVVQRISCYRKYVGLDRGNLDPRVTEAVESHGYYLSENPDQIYAGWNLETAGAPGFSGADALARLEASEYHVPEGSQAFIWEVLGYVEPDVPVAAQVDLGMHDPFARDVYLSPSWDAAGYTEFSALDATLSYMNIVLYYPSGARSGNPVTYPIDGQANVPTTWENAYASYDPLLASIPPRAGYPITFTCGSSRVVAGDNPLSVGVTSSVITGPDGPVEHEVFLPGTYLFGADNSTAILVPREPYEPGASYTVEVSLAWLDHDKDLSLTFTTGSDAAVTPMARVVPAR